MKKISPIKSMITDAPDRSSVGIVIPTLGMRHKWLQQCVTSIIHNSDGIDTTQPATKIVLVCPTPAVQDVTNIVAIGDHLDIKVFGFDEPGLSRAINYGMSKLSPDIEYLGWLGDDDLLAPDSLANQATMLKREKLDWVVGSVWIIDENGKAGQKLTMRSLSVRYAHYGRNYVPQPGALVSRRAWDEVGGLDEGLRDAMDLDLFLKLNASHAGGATDDIVAAYRWHNTSVSSRKESWAENDLIQKRFPRSRFVSGLMSIGFIEQLFNKVAHRLTHRALKKSQPSWIPFEDTV